MQPLPGRDPANLLRDPPLGLLPVWAEGRVWQSLAEESAALGAAGYGGRSLSREGYSSNMSWGYYMSKFMGCCF